MDGIVSHRVVGQLVIVLHHSLVILEILQILKFRVNEFNMALFVTITIFRGQKQEFLESMKVKQQTNILEKTC